MLDPTYLKISFLRLNSREFIASFFFSYVVDSQLPSRGVFSSMILSNPVRIVLTLHAGFLKFCK
jgi:hypothetical protein